MNACPSPYDLSRFGARALPAGSDEIAHHVQSCPRCRQELHVTQDEFAPLWRDRARILAEIEARRTPPWRRWLDALGGPPAWVAVAASLALALFIRPQPAEETLTAKGEAPALEVFRERGGEVARVTPEAVLREGDRLMFRVRSPEPREVMVLGVEASGAVFAYAAPEGHSIPVGEGRAELPVGARLDGSTGREAIVLVSCPSPFEVAQAMQDGRGCERVQLEIQKEAR
jgi:hypothetical protein